MATPPLPPGLDDTPTTRVANRLHSAAIHLLRRARLADRETGLTAERLSLLSVLVFSGPRTMSELAAVEMVSRPAITRTVKALVAEGLVRRAPVVADRRRVMLHATPRGRRLMEEGRKRRVERIAAELAALDGAELGILDRATRTLETL